MKKTEHRMQRICDGLQTKRDVLHFTIEQYKEVYIKAKREFETVVNVSYWSRHQDHTQLTRTVRTGVPARKR